MKLPLNIAQFIWAQRWLHPRLKKNAYKALNKAGIPPSHPFSLNFFGHRYDGNLNNNIEFSIFYYGAFEKPLLYFLSDTLRKIKKHDPSAPCCFCDIGANIGQHSLYMSSHAQVVHSFEPFEGVSKQLLSQIRRNQLSNIVLHKVGLSDVTEMLPFYAPTGSNQGIGSFDEKTKSKGNKELSKLSLFNGDDYFSDYPIDKVHLMKIDVEGFEKRTLAGLQNTLKQQRPIIVCEVSYANDLSFKSLAELVEAFPKKYRFFTFDQRKANGKKDRKKESRAKRSGAYKLKELVSWRTDSQDDIIACPTEKLEQLSMASK